MKHGQISPSAKGVTFYRAMESEKPAGERICYDPLARYFIDLDKVMSFRLRPLHKIKKMVSDLRRPGFYHYFAVRTRYFDDYLDYCIGEGIRQLVILGAGYDSRAYRVDRLKDQAKVFEADHPVTQSDKKAKLVKLLGALPDHVVYVSIDFNTTDLAEQFTQNGYNPELKTLFILEGLTYYLNAEVLDRILRFISQRSGSGSSVIFDYTCPDVISGKSGRREAKIWWRSSLKRGERLTLGLDPDNIENFLTIRGFSQVCKIDNEFLRSKYLKNNQTVTPIYAIVHASV